MNLVTRFCLAIAIAPVLIAQTAFSTRIQTMRPLGYWPLHGNALDASGRGNNAAAVDGVFFTGAVGPLSTGPAANFSSFERAVATMPGQGSSIFDTDGLHPLTALAWIRTVAVAPEVMVVLCKYDSKSSTGWGLLIDNGELGGPPGGGRLALIFIAGDNPTLLVESTISVNDGGWHLVGATYDGSGKASGVRLYLDGVSVASTTAADAISRASIANSAPFAIGNTVDRDSPFEGMINEVAVFGEALTARQFLDLIEDAPGNRRVLSQFAFGGGWYSAIYFANSGTSDVSFPVDFVGDNGTPMSVPSVGGSSKTVNLPPGGSVLIEATNTGPLVQGYASAVLPVGVTGYGVFRQSAPGSADQEAVVPLDVAGAGFRAFLYDETNGLVTAAAILNPSNVDTTVAVSASDSSGHVVGTTSIAIPARSKVAAALRSLPGLGGIVGNVGTVRFSVSTGSLSVLGLRFDGLAFTSIPAVGRARADF